jgi:hypothetical protein
MQTVHPTKLIGPFLYLFRRYAHAMLPCGTRCQLVSDQLLDQPLELASELQCSYEILSADNLVIDPHNRRHHVLLGVESNLARLPLQGI